MYKKITGKTGVKYWKDGKFIKKTDIPASVYQALEINPQYDNSRECIFCGVPGTKIRQFNLMVVNLCDEHYFNKRLGQIAQHIREQGEQNGTDAKILEGQQTKGLEPQTI